MAIHTHTEITKTVVLSLFKDGLSSSQVAQEANKKLRGHLHNLLTRNSVIGIKNRAGLCKPSSEHRNSISRRKKRTDEPYDKSVAFNEKPEEIPYEHQVKTRLIAALER
tara:strand:- start:5932 stop:6258 length:327 start_codon:yes stop_codon:yes gene_type:complete